MLTPLRDKVVVQVKAETSAGGIIIAGVNEKPTEGIVIAVGTGYTTEYGIQPLVVKVDDHVVFLKGKGHVVRDNGTDYLIMPESDILGVKS